MKIAVIVVLAVLFSGCTTTPGNTGTASSRSIIYVSQAPEYLRTVAFTEVRDQYYVSIANLKVRAPDNITPIDTGLFEYLWQSLETNDLQTYKYASSKTSNFADPAYYMVSRIIGTKSTDFRIPKENANRLARNLTERIQLLVRERS